MVTHRAILAFVASMLLASGAGADDATKKPPARPRVSHAPVSVAPAHEPLRITADIAFPERVKTAWLVYRAGKEERYRQVPFQRAAGGPYVAVVPAADVNAPSLDYTIEIEKRDGARIAAFSTRDDPQPVQVPEDGMDQIEEALDQRIDSRRNVFFSSGEYVSFGKSRARVDLGNGILQDRVVDDRYWRVEGGYRYRTLRAVSEFSFRVGVVRGSAPVPVRPPVPGQSEDERFDVGLNYGASTVRFRWHDHWHFDGSLLASVTEVGFSGGTGATLHIGDPEASKLSLGFEWIYDFGARIFSQVDLQAHERVTISPIVEVTNMPSAEAFGVRLLAELGVDIGWGFACAARGGYQARDSTSGGPSGGGTVSYAF